MDLPSGGFPRYFVVTFLSVLIPLSLCSCSSIDRKISKFNAETFQMSVSQYNTGCNYLYGTGVDVDYKTAFEWFTKSARQGHPGAMNNLGHMYENGLGVDRNLFEAVNYYKMAGNKEERWYNELDGTNAGVKKGKENYERLRHVVIKIPTYDNVVFVNYPNYRLDDAVGVVCIIADSENSSFYEEKINNLFKSYLNVRIINPVTVESALKGKLSGFASGLTPEQSRQLHRSFQVDHIVYVTEKVSPHSDYMYGGRIFVQTDLKIVRSSDGEIVFKVIGNYGASLVDPRRYGFSHRVPLDDSSKNALRESCWNKYLHFPLTYALGGVSDGYAVHQNTNIVESVYGNSPAGNAGLRAGDRIADIDGFKIGDGTDYNRYYSSQDAARPKRQGEIRIITVRRGGETVECRLSFPVLPKLPPGDQDYPAKSKSRGKKSSTN